MIITFDPRNPFPVPPASASYADEQVHAAAVDRWLGLRTDLIEAALPHRREYFDSEQELWLGLPTQSLLTPYTEIRNLLEIIAADARECPSIPHLVDLGAAYGRMAWVVAAHFSGWRFTGYECVAERITEGERCFKAWLETRDPALEVERRRILFKCADLSAPDFKPVTASHYFVYDYGTKAAIEKTLQDLRRQAQSRPITVIGRGRASRDLIEHQHPWLSEVVAPRHFGRFSIYRSNE